MTEERNPYENFRDEERILRDQLAIDRTVLANERTFLAYVRTALAFAIVGASCFKFFSSGFMDVIGATSILIGAGFLVVGVWRARMVRRRILGAERTGAKEETTYSR